MLQIRSTVYPASRMHEAQNENVIREGGLYYRDEQKSLLDQAKGMISPKPPKPPKDEVKEFVKMFWIVAVVCAIGYVLYQIVNN